MARQRFLAAFRKSLIPTILVLAILTPLDPHNPLTSVLPGIHEGSATTPLILGIWSDFYFSRSIVDPSQTIGSKVDLMVNVTNAGLPTISNNLDGFDIYLKIDPALVRPVDRESRTGVQPAVLAGGLFDPLLYTIRPFILANTYNSTTGIIRVALALVGDYAPSASGTLFFFQLDVLALGQTEIDVQEQNSLLINPSSVPYSSLDGFFSNKIPVHEIILSAVDVSSEQVPSGDIATIFVGVGNFGTEVESVLVSVKAGTIPLDPPQVMVMSPGDLLTFIFPWDTTGAALGAYVINATATVALDDFPKDNSVTLERVDIVVIDLAVTSIVPANNVFAKRQVAEQFLEVKANVTNEGSVTSRASLALYGNRTLPGQILIGSFSFDISAGATRTFIFQWNITRTGLGTYLLSAEASPLPGEKDTADNNLQDGTVRVFAPTVDVGIATLSTSETFVAVRETIGISGDLFNGGTTDQSFTLRLFANSSIIIEQTEFVAKNSTLRVDVSWNTTGYVAGSYTISGLTVLLGDEYSKNDQFLDGTVSVFVNNVPTVIVEVEPLVPQPGQLVVFNASRTHDPDVRFSDNVATLTWDFGDGSPTLSGANRTAAHTYSDPGSYTVKLTATDSHGGSNSTSIVLRVNAAPSASFALTPSSPESGQDIVFDGSGSTDDASVAVYTWTFGDGAQGTGRQVTHRYSSSGSFNVTLTVTDSDGAAAHTSRVIAVAQPALSALLPLVIGGAAAGLAAVGVAAYLLRRKRQKLPQPSS